MKVTYDRRAIHYAIWPRDENGEELTEDISSFVNEALRAPQDYEPRGQLESLEIQLSELRRAFSELVEILCRKGMTKEELSLISDIDDIISIQEDEGD